MDIILEFYIRNHSGIDLHDTDIDFSGPIILKKKNSLFDLLCVNETVLFYYLCSIEARDLLDLVTSQVCHLPESHGFCLYVWNIW